MNLSDKMSYLKGLVDGMELDLTTKEGKVLGQLLDVLQETVLYVTDLQDQVDELTELCESLDEDLGDVEDAVFGDEEDDEDEADEFEDDDDDYDDDDDDMYEAVCPNCQNTIVLSDSVLDEGTMHCPCCNELLEFDYSDLTMDDLEHKEEDAEDAEDAPCPQAARLKASTRLSESAVTRLSFMVLLLCCFSV